MSQVSNLYRLQLIDTQLAASIARLQNIEKTLSDNLSIVTAQNNVTLAEENQKSLSKILRDAENRSYDTRIKIELSEKSLYSGKIQNPKELQELQNEIASLKRLLSSLEDKQLVAMMDVEDAETKLMWASEELHDEQKRQIEQNAGLTADKTKLLSEIERLEAERKAVLPTMSITDIGIYEQLRKSRNGVAVVKIASKACSACGTTLTAALVQAIQSTGQIVRCPTCGRILYSG